MLTEVTAPEEGEGVTSGGGEAEGDSEFMSVFPSNGLAGVVLAIFGCAGLP